MNALVSYRALETAIAAMPPELPAEAVPLPAAPESIPEPEPAQAPECAAVPADLQPIDLEAEPAETAEPEPEPAESPAAPVEATESPAEDSTDESAAAPARTWPPLRASMANADLAAIMAKMATVAERRNHIPILSNVRILAGHGSAYFTSTDMDLELTVGADCECEQTGALTVPAHALKDFARKAPKDSTVLIEESETETAKIQFGRDIHYRLNTLPVTDFPKLMRPGEKFAEMTDDEAAAGGYPFPKTVFDPVTEFKIRGSMLRELLESTAFAVSTEETRYYLNGVYLHAVHDLHGGRMLVATATDGHRLAKINVPLPEGADNMPAVILPRRTVAVLLKLLAKKACPESVAVRVNESKINFAWQDHSLTSKLIDGTFPDYNRVIPTGHDKHLSVNVQAFKGALESVSAMSNERGRAVKLTLPGDGTMRLTVNNPDQSACEQSISSLEYDGPEFEIGFNADYLLSIIAVACPKGGMLRIDFGDAGSPALFRGERANACFVCMPMRV